MEYTYRLEFNEKQQAFHQNTGDYEPDGDGWFTVYERCTGFKWSVYEAFMHRVVPQKKLTKEYVLECAVQVDAFINNLSERSITISQYGEILPNTTELYKHDDEDVYEQDGHTPYYWSRHLYVRSNGIRTMENQIQPKKEAK